MNKLKVNKPVIEQSTKQIELLKSEYETSRNNVTNYILNNEDEFNGEAANKFKEKLIDVNIATSDVLEILSQYLESFKDYCDYVKEIDDELKSQITKYEV